MAWWKQYRWLVAVLVGLVGGVALCQFWPRTEFEIPIRAMATDRIDTYGMATGPLDSELEAVYFLDFLTGQLTAVVAGKQGGIFGTLQANVAADLHVDPQRNPKFMMVTGLDQPASRGHAPAVQQCPVLRGRGHHGPGGRLRHPMVAHDVSIGSTAAVFFAACGQRHVPRRNWRTADAADTAQSIEFCKPCRSQSTASHAKPPKGSRSPSCSSNWALPASPWRSKSTSSWSRGSTTPTAAWPTATGSRSSPWSEEDEVPTKDIPDPCAPDQLHIGNHLFSSRLLVGTGKYATHDQMREALERSGSQCITVAVRRERLIDAAGKNLLDFIDTSRYTILPNTAGCFTAEDAVRVARLGREILSQLGNAGADWVKLEVLGDKKTLLPDPVASLEATKTLVADGFQVLVYTSDDPVVARRLKEAGATSVMPAGSPIGSGQGVLNPNAIRICLEYLKDGDPDYPVIVDAGVGTASDVTVAMELGVDGVLLNTGIAHAKDPLAMARAMRLACESGRLAYLAGRIPKKLYATASSPTEGVIRAAGGS